MNELIKLKTLFELIELCRTYEQGHNILGGHKSYLDQILTEIYNYVFLEIQKLEKEEI